MLLSAVALSAFAASASAQAINATFVAGLGQFLVNEGFTALAQAVNGSVSTPGTQFLLSNINGTAKTLLAPTNAAFNGLAANATTNSTLLGERLAYHLLSGTFTGDTFSNAPNHTIARTYLADPSLVQLEGNKTQALAFTIEDGRTRVLNQNTVVTITNTTSYENLLIHVVDAVVDVPGTIAAAFDTWNLTALPQILNTLGYTDALQAAKGITIFAPSDEAFARAADTLAQISSNQTLVGSIVSNHYINGTTVYSPLLGSGQYTSAVGSAFSFSRNDSGTFVTSGNSVAKVVQADIIVSNGVVHIIDSILVNDQTNPGAASSAYDAATSSAAAGGQATGPVGPISTPTETGGVGSTNSSSAQRTKADLGMAKLAMQGALVLFGMIGGAALVI